VRIVSLIPEATEILGALGLGDQVVEGLDVGAARPDLIFTSETAAGGGVPRHEVRRMISALRPRPAVYALEPHSLGDILSDIKTVGDATGQQAPARALIEALRVRIDAVSLSSARALAEQAPRRVACLHTGDPPIAAGWWLAELVGLAGGLDILDGVGRPPRAVTWEQIRAAQPDLVVCAGDEGLPYPGPRAVDLLERLIAICFPNGLRGGGDTQNPVRQGRPGDDGRVEAPGYQ
jgi:ABC-type Fe3+-hydroxamate transport system substrate-binding protein